MSYQSDYLKDCGVLSAYQTFIKQLMNNIPKKENALEEAAKFFTNYEKKYKPSLKAEPIITFPEKTREKKERKKIVLETKSRIYPSAPVITPKIFERQERTRPLIGTYKTEKIEYIYSDIFDGQIVKLQGDSINFPAIEDQKINAIEENLEEVEKSQEMDKVKSEKSLKSSMSRVSNSSQNSKISKKSKKSKKSESSSESDSKKSSNKGK